MTEAQYQAEANRIAAQGLPTVDTTNLRKVTKTGIDVMSLVEGQLFTYGKILLLRKTECVVMVSAGPRAGLKVFMPLEFPCVVDGTVYHAAIPEEVAPVETEAKVKRTKAAPGEKTKIQQCREIYAFHKDDLDKAAMCDLFILEAGCTKMGANTYYLTCKKG